MSYIQVDDVGSAKLDRVNKILAGIPQGAFKATYSALKRAGDKAKTQAGRFAAAEYMITKGTFMGNVKEKTQMSGGASGVASMSVSFAGSVLPLLTFNTKYSKDGHITTQVKRNGGASSLERAFVAQVHGRTGVFERVGDSRFPIEGKYGPSTGHMMQNENVIKQMDETIRETYEQRIEHEILRVLNGWGGSK